MQTLQDLLGSSLSLAGEEVSLPSQEEPCPPVVHEGQQQQQHGPPPCLGQSHPESALRLSGVPAKLNFSPIKTYHFHILFTVKNTNIGIKNLLDITSK